MAKLDAGSSYGEYGGGGSDGSFGGASSSAGEGGYGGGQSRQQPFSLATCASVLRFVALCSLAVRRLSGDKDKWCLREAMRPHSTL